MKRSSTEQARAEPEDLSASAKENVELVASLHEQEDAKISDTQLWIEGITSFFGSPGYFIFAVVFIGAWIAGNEWGSLNGWEHIDEPPFFWLQGIVSANALLLTIAVLIRQNRMSRLAQHHAHLDLQINLLTEKKVTTILKLLNDPARNQASPADSDADLAELTKPADPEAILQAIKQLQKDG